jgi:hypothetical protein
MVVTSVHNNKKSNVKLGPCVCEKLRIPHFLNNHLRDDNKAVSFTRRPLFTTQENSFTHSCYRLSQIQGHSAAGKMK